MDKKTQKFLYLIKWKSDNGAEEFDKLVFNKLTIKSFYLFNFFEALGKRFRI